MGDDLKDTLPQDDRLDQLLALVQGIANQVQGMEKRIESLETRVDQRLMETRPIWEAVLARLDKIEGRLDKIEGRLDKADERLESIEKDVRVIRDQVEDAILQVA
jgi:archaellum component FlaC